MTAGGTRTPVRPATTSRSVCRPCPRPNVWRSPQRSPTLRRDELHDLIAALRDPDPRKRARAATALGELKGKAAEAVGPLIALLGDTAATNDFGPTTVSAAAAMALGEIGEPAVAPLIAALGDRSPMVRRMAVIALGGIEDRRVTAAVLGRVKDEDAGVRGTAIAMLSGTDDPRAKRRLSARSPTVPRWSAARRYVSWEGSGTPESRSSWSLPWTTKTGVLHAVMSLTQQAMGGVKELAAVKPLLATLKDEDPELRSTAAQALGEIADPRAVEGLIATLDDKWPNIQARAADSLGSLHDSRAVEPLLAVLRNSSRESARQNGRRHCPRGDRRPAGDRSAPRGPEIQRTRLVPRRSGGTRRNEGRAGRPAADRRVAG